jgi:hypothetical protein
MIDFVTSLCNNGHGREIEEFEFTKEFQASLCLCVEVQDLRVRVLYRAYITMTEARESELSLSIRKHEAIVYFTLALINDSR